MIVNVVDYISVSTTVFDAFRLLTIAARVNDCNGGSVFRRALLTSGSDQLCTFGCMEIDFANRIPVVPCQQ